VRSLIGTAVALAATLALAASAAADIGFAPPVSFPAPDAERLAVGDFNKDGLPDIATADAQAASASVLLGDGMAGFGPATSYPVAGHPADVETADFNGDMNLDLAVTGQNSGNVTILPGAGNGTFGSSFDVPAGVNPNRLAAGDVNGDLKADLVVTSSASGTLTVLRGDGAGGFSAGSSIPAPGPPEDVVLGDMNSDGHPDIVTANGNAGWSVISGPGDGSFNQGITHSVDGEATSVVTADFNGDQKLDAAIGIISKGVTVMLGDGQNSVSAPVLHPTPSASPLALVAADLDGGGTTDLATVGGGVATLTGLGNGKFDAAVAQRGAGVSVVVADLDGDKMPDLVLAANQNVTVLGNVSTPSLPAPVVAKTANADPVSGTVLVKGPGESGFVRLSDAARIPIGSQIDTTKGTVNLTTAAGGGQTQSGVFHGGLFKLGQTNGAHPFTDLKLTAKLRCVIGGKPVNVAAKARRTRQLFGNAHGRFRTRGHNSVATIRGTKWLVKDTCKSTLTVSQKGTVVVQDLVKHRTVTLKSGQRYVARRGNR
jgi:hypothetical protein